MEEQVVVKVRKLVAENGGKPVALPKILPHVRVIDPSISVDKLLSMRNRGIVFEMVGRSLCLTWRDPALITSPPPLDLLRLVRDLTEDGREKVGVTFIFDHMVAAGEGINNGRGLRLLTALRPQGVNVQEEKKGMLSVFYHPPAAGGDFGMQTLVPYPTRQNRSSPATTLTALVAGRSGRLAEDYPLASLAHQGIYSPGPIAAATPLFSRLPIKDPKDPKDIRNDPLTPAPPAAVATIPAISASSPAFLSTPAPAPPVLAHSMPSGPSAVVPSRLKPPRKSEKELVKEQRAESKFVPPLDSPLMDPVGLVNGIPIRGRVAGWAVGVLDTDAVALQIMHRHVSNVHKIGVDLYGWRGDEAAVLVIAAPTFANLDKAVYVVDLRELRAALRQLARVMSDSKVMKVVYGSAVQGPLQDVLREPIHQIEDLEHYVSVVARVRGGALEEAAATGSARDALRALGRVVDPEPLGLDDDTLLARLSTISEADVSALASLAVVLIEGGAWIKSQAAQAAQTAQMLQPAPTAHAAQAVHSMTLSTESTVQLSSQSAKPLPPSQPVLQNVQSLPPQALQSMPQKVQPLPQKVQPLPSAVPPMAQIVPPMAQSMQPMAQNIYSIPSSLSPTPAAAGGRFLMSFEDDMRRIVTEVSERDALRFFPAPLVTCALGDDMGQFFAMLPAELRGEVERLGDAHALVQLNVDLGRRLSALFVGDEAPRTGYKTVSQVVFRDFLLQVSKILLVSPSTMTTHFLGNTLHRITALRPCVGEATGITVRAAAPAGECAGAALVVGDELAVAARDGGVVVVVAGAGEARAALLRGAAALLADRLKRATVVADRSGLLSGVGSEPALAIGSARRAVADHPEAAAAAAEAHGAQALVFEVDVGAEAASAAAAVSGDLAAAGLAVVVGVAPRDAAAFRALPGACVVEITRSGAVRIGTELRYRHRDGRSVYVEMDDQY